MTMVAIQRESRRKGNLRTYIIISSVFVLVLVVLVSLKSEKRAENRMKPRLVPIERPETTIKSPVCPYETFDDLSPEELYPTKGSRHMVNPPKGGQLTLLCCETTKGPWSLVVHDKWAPLGAARFLEMVSSRYMDSEIPLFRCIQNFICQFGLSSDASLSKLFKKSIQDDKNWLPEGPAHREHEGVKRFAKGYIAYAGGGKNSRNNQLIISLTDVGALAGGSPWEVPFGELVGKHSFETLGKIYTGYGENGPKQGQLLSEGMDEHMRTTFPRLDYLKSCHIVDRRMQPEKF